MQDTVQFQPQQHKIISLPSQCFNSLCRISRQFLHNRSRDERTRSASVKTRACFLRPNPFPSIPMCSHALSAESAPNPGTLRRDGGAGNQPRRRMVGPTSRPRPPNRFTLIIIMHIIVITRVNGFRYNESAAQGKGLTPPPNPAPSEPFPGGHAPTKKKRARVVRRCWLI